MGVHDKRQFIKVKLDSEIFLQELLETEGPALALAGDDDGDGDGDGDDRDDKEDDGEVDGEEASDADTPVSKEAGSLRAQQRAQRRARRRAREEKQREVTRRITARMLAIVDQLNCVLPSPVIVRHTQRGVGMIVPCRFCSSTSG